MGANGNKKDTKKFAQEVDEITNGEYTLVGEYVYSNIDTTIRHNICGNCFTVKPVNFCRKEKYIRCPHCSTATNKKKTTEQFKKEVCDIDSDFIVLGEYIDTHTKIKMKHLKCGREFSMKPNHFLSGERCPFCSINYSKVEGKLTKYINNNFSQYSTRKIRKKDSTENKFYEVDIFIPELNIGFEYNGIYWHSLLNKDKYYHRHKQDLFLQDGIKIYFLWEHWGENVCEDIITHIIANDNQIECYPYIKTGTKYLYANKDLYPANPPYVDGYKCIGDILKKENIKISDSHIFEIYNSGYWKYIKQ